MGCDLGLVIGGFGIGKGRCVGCCGVGMGLVLGIKKARIVMNPGFFAYLGCFHSWLRSYSFWSSASTLS